MDTETLGKRIRQARAEHRYTQEQLAAELGVNNKTVSAIENGHTVPRAGTAAGLERIFGWAPGAISAILAGGEPTDTPAPVQSAADLSDEELAAEVTYRLLSRNRAVTDSSVSNNDTPRNGGKRSHPGETGRSNAQNPTSSKDGFELAARKRHPHDK